MYRINELPLDLFEIQRWDDDTQQWVKACPWLLDSKQEAEQVIAYVTKAEQANG